MYSLSRHKAKQERQAAVIRVEGVSEAADLISNALKTSGTGLNEVCSVPSCITVYSVLHFEMCTERSQL